jgi:hypothetical protein
VHGKKTIDRILLEIAHRPLQLFPLIQKMKPAQDHVQMGLAGHLFGVFAGIADPGMGAS